MNKFTQAAKDALGGSRIMKDRVKISTDDIIAKYPNGVTIDEFDLIQKADGSAYPVFAFRENPTCYFNGGALAKKIVDEWIKMYDGDIDTACDDLKGSGGVKFRLSHKKTRTGKTITAFDPVE